MRGYVGDPGVEEARQTSRRALRLASTALDSASGASTDTMALESRLTAVEALVDDMLGRLVELEVGFREHVETTTGATPV